jgi:uncharacterized membrane protein YfcA
MLSARVILLAVLVAVNVTAIIVWITVWMRRQVQGRPTWADGAIGYVTSFLDTLGIGSYAQITAVFKLRGRPDDELIPGTLNVGSFVASFVGSLLFFTAFGVEPVLLASMVISSGVGAWVGSGLVSRMPRRVIQVFMGIALLIAAFFFGMTALHVLPPSGTAMGLSGWRFVVAVLANGVFGALMCIGIGNYAPSMVLLGLLGMHPIAAYPIMFLSDGVLIPVASLGFLRSKRFSHGCAVGLACGGVLGVLCAFPLVELISKHLTWMRWLVIVVIVYAAVSMLRSARAIAVTSSPEETSGAS